MKACCAKWTTILEDDQESGMDMDFFLKQQNIRRYRRLLDCSVGPIERQAILKLLAEEMAKMKDRNNAGDWAVS